MTETVDQASPAISKSQFATLVGVTKGRISQLTAAGQPLAPALIEDGKRLNRAIALELFAVQAADPEAIVSGKAGDPAALPLKVSEAADLEIRLKEERLERVVEERRDRAIARGIRDGTLVDTAAAQAKVAEILRELRRDLEALGRDLAQDLVGITDPREIRVEIDARHEQLLARARDRLEASLPSDA